MVFSSPVSHSSQKQMQKSEQEQVEVFDPPLYFVFEPCNSFLVSTVFGSGNFLSLKWFVHLSLGSSSTLLFSPQVFFPPASPLIRISAARLTPTWENPFNHL